MDQEEEKFFEALANHKIEPEEDLGVQLVKAGSTIQSKSRVSAKTSEDGVFDNEPEGQLTIDVYQTPDEIVVESAIAGVRPEDLDIQATTDSITIKGKRHREKEVKDDDYLYQECYWGRFSRSVILPQEVDPEKAVVSFKNGILIVRLPKLNRQRSKKLKVKIE